MRPLRYAPALAFALAACGGKTLVVDSDTSWQGTADVLGQVAGRGHRELELPDLAEICWSIAKSTEAGTLRAYAETSTWFGLGSDVSGEAATTAPSGAVSGCVR